MNEEALNLSIRKFLKAVGVSSQRAIEHAERTQTWYLAAAAHTEIGIRTGDREHLERGVRMFAEMGCHAEHVRDPAEFRPALERALRAGRTALINVIGDRRVGHPSLGGNLLGSTRV